MMGPQACLFLIQLLAVFSHMNINRVGFLVGIMAYAVAVVVRVAIASDIAYRARAVKYKRIARF